MLAAVMLMNVPIGKQLVNYTAKHLLTETKINGLKLRVFMYLGKIYLQFTL